jgi:hypothetical protein
MRIPPLRRLLLLDGLLGRDGNGRRVVIAVVRLWLHDERIRHGDVAVVAPDGCLVVGSVLMSGPAGHVARKVRRLRL